MGCPDEMHDHLDFAVQADLVYTRNVYARRWMVTTREAWERLLECGGFEWDSGNSSKIRENQGVTPLECEELFFNRPLVVGSDEAHSAGEERFYALGQTDGGRLLFVAFAIRGRLIRAISPRDMSRKERRAYRSQ